MNKKSTLLQRFVSAPYTVWSVLFIVIPLVMVVYYSFTDSKGSFTVDNIYKLAEREYISIFARSVAFAFVATVVCLLIAFPLAYFISQTKPRIQKTAIMLTMLPMWTNLIIRTYSLGNLIEDTGVINTFLNFDSPIHMINTPFAVIWVWFTTTCHTWCFLSIPLFRSWTKVLLKRLRISDATVFRSLQKSSFRFQRAESCPG